MATRDVTCVRGPLPRCACVRAVRAVLCLLCAVPCYAMRLTCLAVLGACVFPPSFEPTRFMPCDRVGSGLAPHRT